MINIQELNQKEHIGKSVFYRKTPEATPAIGRIINWNDQLILIFTMGKEIWCYPQALDFRPVNETPGKLEISLFVHAGEKLAARDKALSAGLSKEAAGCFSWAGYEHEMTYEVDTTTGDYTLIRVDGREVAPAEG